VSINVRESEIDTTRLRPVERRILAMRSDGHTLHDIAGRLKRSPEHVERMIRWTEIPRSDEPYKFTGALEARVLALREQGMDYEEIGRRFKRSARNVRLVEALAHYRRALSLLRRSN
jgi:DNA-binding CsgD family transcriptional regulator